MLDAEVVSPDSTRFLFPWATAGQYLDSSRVHMTPTSQYDPTNPASAPTDSAWSLDDSGAVLPVLSGSYPNNMLSSTGTEQSWITESNFHNCTWQGSSCLQPSGSPPMAGAKQPFLGTDPTIRAEQPTRKRGSLSSRKTLLMPIFGKQEIKPRAAHSPRGL